jgi:hypothetical protein
MGWRYKFDGGPEKAVDCASGLYVLAALKAFAQEPVEKLPTIKMGVHGYDGHMLTLWSTEVVPEYGPYNYGIGLNEAQSLLIVNLAD